MHEFALATSIKEIIYDNIAQLEKEKKYEVINIRVRYGLLSQVVPEILSEAFASLAANEALLKNAKLDLVLVKPLLECTSCNTTFSSESKDALFLPCPHCQHIGSHKLKEGTELIVDHIEITEL